MKLKTQNVGLAILLAGIMLNWPWTAARAQGSLTPPGAPAPTMKSLAQIEPRIPISALPYSITNPGSYYVTTNLTGTSGLSGISIASDNVTLDLNGFTLQGVPGSMRGIFCTTSHYNLVVRNGTLTGWGGSGLDCYSSGFPRNMVFEHLVISGNGAYGLEAEADCIIRDCVSFGNTNDGFNNVGGELTHCISRDNGGFGFSAGVIETGSSCSFRDCMAEYNTGGGFTLISSEAQECDSQYNAGPGFTLSSSSIRNCNSKYNSNNGINCNGMADEIRDCRILSNQGQGIFTTNAGGARIEGNTVILNTYNGIYINSSGNFVENNQVLSPNYYAGIQVQIGLYGAVYSNNVVVKNMVFSSGGGGGYIDTGETTDFGPIGTAAGATNPWANLFH
jgi:parallel beta-helix repeat protein